jgi:hypothetical protein
VPSERVPRYPRHCPTRLLARSEAGGLSAAVHSGHASDLRPPTPVNAPGIGKPVQVTLVTVSYAHLTHASLLLFRELICR